MNEELDTLKNAFNRLRLAGKVRTQSDFATLLGVNRSTVSSALNGDKRYLSPSLVERAKLAADQAERPTEEKQTEDVTIPGNVVDLYRNLVTCNTELSETVKTQQDTIKILVELIRDEKGAQQKVG